MFFYLHMHRINAQGSELRSIPEIRKEPSDIKSGVKETERERRLLRQQTAGGPPPTLSSSNEEVKMLSFYYSLFWV